MVVWVKVMNGQPGVDKPAGDQGGGKDVVPKLVFEPDSARQARIRKAWALAAWLILGCLAIVLVWLATYRPRLSGQDRDSELPVGVTAVPSVRSSSLYEQEVYAETGQSAETSSLSVSPAQQASPSPAEVADDIGRLARSALSRWSLVLDMTLAEELRPTRARDMLSGLATLRTQLDSADAETAVARDRSTEVGRATRTSTDNTYKLSVLYVASDRVAGELGRQAQEVRDYLQSVQAALRAAAAGDDDEFEVKANVANGHLRRAEKRRRLIDSRLQSLAQIAGEIGG